MSTAMKKQLCKAKKAAHPNSRKTLAIIKKMKKISNRENAKVCGLIKQNILRDKLIWFHYHLTEGPYTPESTADLVERYLARNDEELEQISIKHSIGGRRNRQHASREDILRLTKKQEREEYETCGIVIPNILNGAQCKLLQKWEGDANLMTNFKFRRFGKKHLIEALRKKDCQETDVNEDFNKPKHSSHVAEEKNESSPTEHGSSMNME